VHDFHAGDRTARRPKGLEPEIWVRKEKEKQEKKPSRLYKPCSPHHYQQT
jgi:hypothetical protein